MTQAFNLSQFANKVNTSGQADLTTAVTGTLPIANGGTGASSLAGNSVTITDAGGTALTTVAAGTTGNVLTSNGTTWISQAASGGQLQTELFTAPGTWTKPASCTQVRVTVVGGGGGGSPSTTSAYGGLAIALVPVSNPVAITVGAGGAANATGGTSSFGPAVSATGGGTTPVIGPGAGTVSVGTALLAAPFRGGVSPISSQSSMGIIIGSGGKSPSASPSPQAYSATLGVVAGGNAPSTKGGVGGAIVVEFVG
jgi:hypothetical protein